jgi:hypothetical protein
VRSWKIRILLLLVGLAVGLVGLFAWSFEQEYGSGANFGLESRDGTVVVYDVDEQAGTESPVFQGSAQQAQAYMERRRAEGESFVIPGLIVALGAVLVLPASSHSEGCGTSPDRRIGPTAGTQRHAPSPNS